ncbi:chemotaxis protein CheA [Yoonia sp.]|uniref:chemotaxis protein CheA n=1 Tax=Yoonia sp. TaxID=2212373 RepID=UPI0019D92450|nr:chemotaxis protein CheA [Yoonia sp.]MBE0413990.1 chemotaxis protein CheA [Yoonia sp.]
MNNEPSLLDTFFEECEDLIIALSDGLTEMRDGQADNETINAVFRAVHSIKGAAGAFALDDLVNFAHKFETVLDDVRAQRLAPDDSLLRTLQRAGDMLADLVDNARNATPANRALVDPVLAELQAFLGPEEDTATDEFVFEPMSLDLGGQDDTSPVYRISFTPGRTFYALGHDPLLLILAIQDLGPTEICVTANDLPNNFSNLHWDDGYLTWTITLSGPVSDLPIREIFQFVDDLCDLRIENNECAPFAQTTFPDHPPQPEPESGPTTDAPQRGLKDEQAERTAIKPTTTLRVDPERIDRLINAVGELIINQSVISQRLQEAALPNSSELFADLDDYKLLAREIQEGVMAIRAQPVKPLFQRMLRIAREASDATGKSVVLITEGETTEVDKTVIERLADPLTHMIRNAIDHGIESPEKRIKSGKAQQGIIRLSASQRSGSIVIEIADDGAGLNRPQIRDTAIKKGLIADDTILSDQEIDQLLFAPGFSTAAEVTNLSGRGVGMDVVKTTITGLGGRVAISTVPGRGTTFSITLPLTLAVMDGMIINVSGQTMVVPITNILETIRPSQTDLSKIGLNNDLLRIRGDYVPIIDLAERLGHAPPGRPLTDRVLLLIQTESIAQCALAVDDIYDQRQVVVKSLQGNYGYILGVSGATILGDGKIALIIDPEAITNTTSVQSQIAQPTEGGRSYVAA